VKLPTSALQAAWHVAIARLKQLWDNPPLDPEVRVRIAEETVRWVLLPSLVVAGFAALAICATVGFSEPTRWYPLLVFVLPSVAVYRLQRARRWLAAAGVLCGTGTLTVVLAILLNSVYAPAYCLGVLVVTLIVTLFGFRWGLAGTLVLIAAGGLWLIFDAHGVSTGVRIPAASTTYCLYVGFLLLALGMVGGPQRMLSDALREAKHKHEEAVLARSDGAASETAFHAVFDQASVALLLLTAGGRITRLNPRAAALLGHGDATLLGCRLPLAPSWNEAQRHLLQDAVEKAALGQACRHEVSLSRGGGPPAVLQVTLSPFLMDTGSVEHVLVEVVDVSDLIETRSMLAQARRLEALGKLSGGVAHDLNNMLTAILAGCELMRFSRGDPRMIAENVELIQASTLRAASLTKQLLAFGRKDRWNSEQLDANRLVDEVARLLQRTLHKNIDLVVAPGDDPMYVRADAAALEHALLNLALNAQDAMPSGGTLTISCRTALLDSATCARTSGELAPGPCVVISVEDTGTGISTDVREHMFEPFFTTKAPGEGTGLGLAAVHGTVRGHRGGIAVASQEGIGTQIAMILPAIEGSVMIASEPSDTVLPTRLHARVLLADDEALARSATTSLLEALGCEVQSVSDGTALIDAIAEGADPDVIVSDLAMPGLGGVNLVQTLEAMRPHCALLLITGFSGDDVSNACPARSGRRLLRKPFSRAELLRALSELLASTAALPRRGRRFSGVAPKPEAREDPRPRNRPFAVGPSR
jgi:two-component system cell cycle sensor histidine kinase/response regulator CckA